MFLAKPENPPQKGGCYCKNYPHFGAWTKGSSLFIVLDDIKKELKHRQYVQKGHLFPKIMYFWYLDKVIKFHYCNASLPLFFYFRSGFFTYRIRTLPGGSEECQEAHDDP
jgi:hypothetical protein